MTGPIEPGRCRFCGCTEADRCRLADGDECTWYESTRTVCSGPGCVRQYEAERSAARRLTRRLTPAEIHEQIRRRGRRARPRKGRRP